MVTLGQVDPSREGQQRHDEEGEDEREEVAPHPR